jgi:hypothetical protein
MHAEQCNRTHTLRASVPLQASREAVVEKGKQSGCDGQLFEVVANHIDQAIDSA